MLRQKSVLLAVLLALSSSLLGTVAADDQPAEVVGEDMAALAPEI